MSNERGQTKEVLLMEGIAPDILVVGLPDSYVKAVNELLDAQIRMMDDKDLMEGIMRRSGIPLDIFTHEERLELFRKKLMEDLVRKLTGK